MNIPHSALPNSSSGSATVTLETLNGSTSLGSNSYTFTVTVPTTIVPSIGGLSTTPVNSGASSTAFGWGLYIQNKTKCTAAMSSVSAGSGATIRSYSITTTPNFGSGTSTSLTTALLSGSGTVTITAKVTDSRGRTATRTASITVRAYAPPQLTTTPTVYRCISNGDRDDIEGKYALVTASFSYSSVNGNNSLTVHRVELNGVNTNLTSGTAVTIGADALALDNSYTATIRLTDVVGSTTVYTLTIPSAKYVFHIRKGGQSLGIGCAAGNVNNRIDSSWSFRSKAVITSESEFQKYATGIDISKANNNVSENTYPIGYRVMDSTQDHTIGFLSGIAYPEGKTGMYIQADNYNTSGQMTANGYFGVRVAKDGSVDYMISHVGAFRQSIGLGNATGALPIANGGTGSTTDYGGLAALGTPRVNVSWKDSPIGISHYFYESTTAASTYDLPHNYVEVLVLKRSATRGIALAYRWANKMGGFWKNNLTDTWQGWVNGNEYYKSGEEAIGTWIDGKTIYRYTWTGTKAISASQPSMFTLPSTPDTVITLRGIRKRSNGNQWAIPYAYYSNDNWDMGIYIDSSNVVYVGAGSGYGSTTDTFTIFVEYTK